MSQCFNSPASLELVPPLDTEDGQDLVDIGINLQSKAASLAGRLHPNVATAVGDLVRGMNCYYSNLIEGSDTLPREIAAALNANWSTDARRRDLQQEAVAHIAVQQAIDEGELDHLLDDMGALSREIHRRFYELLPAEMHKVRHPETKEVVGIVVPGEYRTDEIIVGRHNPVDAALVPAFMDHLSKGYAFGRMRKLMQPVAVAAAHHRLLWVHPFLDGNGRVTRLISHAAFRHIGVGSPLWSVARGLARSEKIYKQALDEADFTPQGLLDGRGTLSRSRLVDFCRFFLLTAIDQVTFMGDLLQPEALAKRLSEFIKLAAMRNELDARLDGVLQRALMLGEVARGELPAMLGVVDRQARRLVEPAVKMGLLAASGKHDPYRLSFPLDLSEVLFPNLFKPVALDTGIGERLAKWRERTAGREPR